MVNLVDSMLGCILIESGMNVNCMGIFEDLNLHFCDFSKRHLTLQHLEMFEISMRKIFWKYFTDSYEMFVHQCPDY